MVRISDVWDRSVAFARAHAATLAGIMLALAWLPGLIGQGVQLALVGPSPATPPMGGPMGGIAALIALLDLAAVLLALVGTLAVVALASGAATNATQALRLGLRRLLPALGVGLLLALGLAVLTLPAVLPVLAAYPDIAAMQAGTAPALSPAANWLVQGYSLVLTVLLVWLEARLLVLWPIVMAERRGLGAVARAFRLTRGLTWRLVGTVLLFAVVAGVALLAQWSVAGTFWWLVVGPERPALGQFLLAATVSLLTTALATVVAVFGGQLYLALAGEARVAEAPTATSVPPVRSGPWG